jgi:broad specificity phosphatase PhoE
MSDLTILLMRHAEKPEKDGKVHGVDATGQEDGKSLTPRGWQRAGAWCELFVPSLGSSSPLPRPAAIFASAPAGHHELASGEGGSKSRRPLETITPLAARLGIAVDIRFTKGQEAELAAALSTMQGIVLVCWQHEDIAKIAEALTPKPHQIPEDWPSDRFNVVFRLDRSGDASAWAFQQVVPVMLDGDKATGV